MSGQQPLRFTRHARNRMRLYKVSQTDVEAALGAPDRVTPSQLGRQNAWKEQGRRQWLRVTYVTEARTTVVITVSRLEKGPQGKKR